MGLPLKLKPGIQHLLDRDFPTEAVGKEAQTGSRKNNHHHDINDLSRLVGKGSHAQLAQTLKYGIRLCLGPGTFPSMERRNPHNMY